MTVIAIVAPNSDTIAPGSGPPRSSLTTPVIVPLTTAAFTATARSSGERADTALTTDCASAGEAAAITVPATAAESTHFHLSARNPRAGSPAVTRPMALLRSGYEPTTVNVTSRDTVFRETMSVTVMPSRYSPS